MRTGPVNSPTPASRATTSGNGGSGLRKTSVRTAQRNSTNGSANQLWRHQPVPAARLAAVSRTASATSAPANRKPWRTGMPGCETRSVEHALLRQRPARASVPPAPDAGRASPDSRRLSRGTTLARPPASSSNAGDQSGAHSARYSARAWIVPSPARIQICCDAALAQLIETGAQAGRIHHFMHVQARGPRQARRRVPASPIREARKLRGLTSRQG